METKSQSAFICLPDEYIMMHKSVVAKLADMLPLGEEENKIYGKFDLLMEIMEVHRISKEWKEKNNVIE